MQHQHFDKIPSTQLFLREHLEEFSDTEVLISCDEQTQGIGRTGNSWDFYPKSLAMSFTITPNTVPSLTSIEIGLLTLEFIKKKFDQKLLLKWPNDLMTIDSKKCGGIISHYINTSKIIVGLGINFSIPTKNYQYPTDGISINQEIFPKDLSLEIYRYILANRILNSKQLTEQFLQNCVHQNQLVTLIDGVSVINGVFKGINHNGEALIEIKDEIKTFIAGSLLLK
jgi:BirA family biotin operon repressor/biotin-[acetyl-CoA-carboxylase] ligase